MEHIKNYESTGPWTSPLPFAIMVHLYLELFPITQLHDLCDTNKNKDSQHFVVSPFSLCRSICQNRIAKNPFYHIIS
jgi:hypothetical protein